MTSPIAAQIHRPRGVMPARQPLQPGSATEIAADCAELRSARLAAQPPDRRIKVIAAPSCSQEIAAIPLPVVSIAAMAVVTALALCTS